MFRLRWLIYYILHEISCNAVSRGQGVVELVVSLRILEHFTNLDGLPVHAVVSHLPLNSVVTVLQVLFVTSGDILLSSIQTCSICGSD